MTSSYILQKVITEKSINSPIFCRHRKTLIDKSVCANICLQYTERHLSQEIPLHDINDICPYSKARIKEESATPPLGISEGLSKGQNLNIIQEQFFCEPDLTKRQVKSLQQLDWIGHKHSRKWPDCTCLACCAELIIAVMEKAVDAIQIAS